MSEHKPNIKPSFRKAGWSSICSGLAGILSFAALIAALTTRAVPATSNQSALLFRTHDAGTILQFLLWLPAVFALYYLLVIKKPGTRRGILNTGITAIVGTALFLLLIFPNVLADILYMFPQGLFGGWLIAVNWKLKGMLPVALRWFGMIVGLGLVLVGIFPPAYAIFVDPILIHIPAPPTEIIEQIPVNTPANIFLHQVLSIGSFMGVMTLPVYTIILGIVLVKKQSDHFK